MTTTEGGSPPVSRAQTRRPTSGPSPLTSHRPLPGGGPCGSTCRTSVVSISRLFPVFPFQSPLFVSLSLLLSSFSLSFRPSTFLTFPSVILYLLDYPCPYFSGPFTICYSPCPTSPTHILSLLQRQRITPNHPVSWSRPRTLFFTIIHLNLFFPVQPLTRNPHLRFHVPRRNQVRTHSLHRDYSSLF